MSARAVVEVDGRKRSVLYVEGEPRWEYKFIRRAADSNRALKVVSAVRATPNRYYRQGVSSGAELEKGFPATAAELFAYDAVVIGSLEAAALSTEQHEWLKEFVDRRGGSLLLLAGRDGLGDGGWGRVPVGLMLPAVLPAGSERSYGALNSHAQLTDYGRESPIGRLDNDPDRNEKLWKELPALTDFQDLGKLRPGAVVLLEAASGTGSNARVSPLLVTQRYGRGATYLMGTATTWHWQMQLPAADPAARRQGRPAARDLLAAIAQCAGKPLADAHFAAVERAVYEDDQPVVLEAEVLDESYRPVTNAKLTVRAVSDTGVTVPATIEPSGRNDGRYDVAVDARNVGLYRVELAATLGNKDLGSSVTHLRRTDGVLEQFSSWQHRPMLERLAHDTGGRYWTLDDLDGLPEAIRYSRAGMVERQTLDLWNIPLAFLLLALLNRASGCCDATGAVYETHHAPRGRMDWRGTAVCCARRRGNGCFAGAGDWRSWRRGAVRHALRAMGPEGCHRIGDPHRRHAARDQTPRARCKAQGRAGGIAVGSRDPACRRPVRAGAAGAWQLRRQRIPLHAVGQ